MKKLINIKSTKKLTESSIKVGDINYSNRLRKRLVDTARALELAKENNCTKALLKAKSPSCGKDLIYDGTFTGKKKEFLK